MPGGTTELARQLALPVTLPDDTDFDNYLVVTEAGGQARALLERPPAGTLVHLWGAPATGKTHLALAGCRRGAGTLYLPLAAVRERAPEQVLGNLDDLALLALDELDAVAGDDDWERELFHLHNRLLERGGSLVVASRAAPRALPLRLPDLRSRLLAGYGFALARYDDDQCLAVLRFRAARLGLTLNAEAGRYLVNRAPRELGALIAHLRVLDRAALADQRLLTVPFIKRVFGW
jgi:DnaA family protein